MLVNAAGVLERCNEQTLPALYKVGGRAAEQGGCVWGLGRAGASSGLAQAPRTGGLPTLLPPSLAPSHSTAPPPLHPPQYVGRSFRASPRQLGFITLACALVQAVCAPLGGLAGHYLNRCDWLRLPCGRGAALPAAQAGARAHSPPALLKLCPPARPAPAARTSWLLAALCGA